MEWLTTGSTAEQTGPLGQLAPDVLEMIFDQLPEFRDVAFLCLTCKFALRVGKRRLRRVTQETFGPWAGCRLVCLGDFFSNMNLPKGLLTAGEKRELEAVKMQEIQDDDDDRLYNFAETRYKRVFGDKWGDDPLGLERHVPEEMLLRQPRVPGSAVCADIERYKALSGPRLFQDSDMALCNLSKGLYVRLDGITVPFDRISLSHALLSQICWSDLQDFAMNLDDDITRGLVRGRWAGDMFCVTRMKALPDVPKGLEKWTDVTEEIDALLRDIWSQTEEWHPRKLRYYQHYSRAASSL